VTATTAANPIVLTTGIAHGLSSACQQVQIVGVGLAIDGTTYVNGAATIANTGNVDADGVWYAKSTGNTTLALYQDSACTVGVDGTVGTTSSPPTSGSNKGGGYGMVMLPAPPGLAPANATVANNGFTGSTLADYIPTNYRDLDPVRRPCANNGAATLNLEDVCGRDNQLGLVLTVNPPNFLNTPVTTAGEEKEYPGTTGTTPAICTATNFAVQAAKLVDPIQSSPGTIIFDLGTCPNGDPIEGGNRCVTPVNSTAGTQCYNPPSNKPFVFHAGSPLVPAPGAVLGTVYNSRLMTTANAFEFDKLGLPITGAWYRIHQTDVISGSGASVSGGANVNGGTGTYSGLPCVQQDATNQIGCLVQASPCSIAYAGGSSLVWNGSASANGPLELNQQFPDQSCVLSFKYPFSRKLYLNSIQGWGAASGPEQGLALCEASETTMASILTNEHFYDFPAGSAPNNGSPFAEDFNENLVCPGQAPPATNVNSNTFTTATLGGLPTGTQGTTCGNGIREIYEDCDDGTPGAGSAWPTAAVPNGTNGGNGGSSSFCTTTCRWANAGFSPDTAGTVDTTPGTQCASGCQSCAAASAANGTDCHTSAAAAGKCQGGPAASACLAN
jgi:hypothetical protein